MKEHILMVGCGNMGGALLEGCLRGGHEVSIIETQAQILGVYKARGIAGYNSVDSFRMNHKQRVTMVIYAVKPQVAGEIIPNYRFLSDPVIHVSIMAGISLRAIEDWLDDTKGLVVRTMPNLPIKVGEGAIVSVGNTQIDEKIRKRIDGVFCNSGKHLWLDDEKLLHAVTALSGSGPGYVFYYMEELVKAGVLLGLSEDLALELVVKTLSGSAIMAEQEIKKGVSLKEQRERVTSKGGTTEAGISVLKDCDNGLCSLLVEATKMAKERSIELGGGKE